MKLAILTKAISDFSQAPWLFNDASVVDSTVNECEAIDGMTIGMRSRIILIQ
jgi:hypothetical protein